MDTLTIVSGLVIGVFQLLGFTASTNITGLNVVLVPMSDGGSVQSPGFPETALTPWNVSLILEGSKGYFRMNFIDLDLPYRSLLFIHDGADSQSPLLKIQPRQNRGVWMRPVVASSGPALYLNYTPGVSADAKPTIGFKAQYLTTSSPPSEWTFNKPFTNCPVLRRVATGGMIQLTTVSHLEFGIKYEFDCVWQLKVSQHMRNAGMRVYARVTEMEVDGKVEIKEGISSDGSLLASNGPDFLSVSDLETLNQPVSGFSSHKGLYIRVRKPTDSGKFTFVYGMYKPIEPTDATGSQCSYEFDGKSRVGFYCRSSRWCIPNDHRCNTVKNCPQGEDESGCFVVTTTTTTTVAPTNTPVPTTQKPVKECMGKKCPDGSCLAYSWDECGSSCEKECKDGSCVGTFDTCPGECENYYQKCKDGSCVYLFNNCPGECGYSEKRCDDESCVDSWESCPGECSYSEFECSNGDCTYTSDKCDGYSDCSDGSDEWNCDSYYGSSSSNSGNRWLYLIISMPILIFTFICSYLCKKSKRQQRESANVINNQTRSYQAYSGTRMTPVGADTGHSNSNIVITGTPPHGTTYTTNSNNSTPNTNDYSAPSYDPSWSQPVDPAPTAPPTDGYNGVPLETPPPAYQTVADDGTTVELPPPPSYEEAVNRT